MTGSLAGLVNVLFLPGISQWSDGFRSKIGRRIPFLYVVTPMVVGSLILIGFTPEIGGWLFYRIQWCLPWEIEQGSFILTLLGVTVVSFHFLNMVLVNAYNWLIRDVVPLPVMARFLAWFRIVGTVSSVFFLWFVFPHLLSHRREICLGVGLFYLVVFLSMCSQVKEGEYPPFESKEHRTGFLRTFAAYFRDSLRVPLYRHFFFAYLLVMSATSCANSFSTLFMKESLGISMDGMGHIFSWTAALSAIVFFPVGWLCDRFSPLWITLGSVVGLSLLPLFGYFAVQTWHLYMIYSLLFTLPIVAWTLGSMATAMLLFPAIKFGQFSSGLNVFGCGGLIVGNYLIGTWIDTFHNDYRLAFLWTTILAGIAIFPMFLVIRHWKRQGGPNHYIAPLPDEAISNS
ncbi:MAG: MFS transporter [Verrucomicrobia bacterium]|nr:MFS transporter [Verrucomicrobiota bacterium]